MIRRFQRLTAILIAVTAVAKSAPAAQESFPLGDPMRDRIAFEYAIYLLGKYDGDLEKLMAADARRLAPKLAVLKALPEKPPAGMILVPSVERDVAHKYAPPAPHSLKYFARGLSSEQATQVQSSPEVLILNFAHMKNDVWTALRGADDLAEAVARETNGLIWDENARLLYTPDEWHKQRVATWTTTPPDLWHHIAIHSYKNGEYIRAITLGMGKFGLPDVVVDQFSWSDDRAIGNLITSFAQAMAEGAHFDEGGLYNLDLRALKNATARERQLQDIEKGATSTAHLHLLKGRADEGDPPNRLIEISFDRYPGSDARERQDAMLATLFGSKESVAHIKHTDELLEASRKAVARLPALRKAFLAGLAPGEFIDVKVPFAVPTGGREYMWVEIDKWSNDGTIQGLLRNDPEKVPGLRAGGTVEVNEDDVFDYLLHHADGSLEGNETSRIIMKMQRDSSAETTK